MKKLLSIAFLIFVSNMLRSQTHTITTGDLVLEINEDLQSKISSKHAKSPYFNEFQNSEYIKVWKNKVTKFKENSYASWTAIDYRFGISKEYIFSGINEETKIEKQLKIKMFEDFSDFAVFNVSYINHSGGSVKVTQWVNNNYKIKINSQDSIAWSFQGSSTSERADWILPVEDDFYQQNYMGMNNSDYGGGIPVTDIWRRDAGIAVGHTTLYPQLVSLPVEREYKSDIVNLSVEKNYKNPLELASGDTLNTLETFVAVHNGDCFHVLHQYTDYMKAKGLKFAEPEDAAYEPIWCAWGYERSFTIDEIIGTLPKVKELGFKWAVLDDGFQVGEGQWEVNKNKFPQGDKQMKDLVDEIHSYGLKAKLWWAPLAVDPDVQLLKDNPDIILYTEEWIPRIISWWNSYYMSPVYKKTMIHTDTTLNLFMDKWGFDGLKMDGQHMNAVPPDHHPKHKLKYPEQACEQLPLFYKHVYDKARSKKPNAVIENCPCGCCMSFYNMPYINQAVSSDPLSSWQIRLKGKVYKAILGKIAYYGDHVELSDGAEDFASSFGIGAVLGSKFTWPKDNPKAEGKYVLTPEKEKKWKKWIGLYNKIMLSKENYLGELYDIGFDRPEAHVIQKDNDLYYAFYAEQFDGTVELRGLDKSKKYKVLDYFNNVDYGQIYGKAPKLKVKFKKYLLLKVSIY